MTSTPSGAGTRPAEVGTQPTCHNVVCAYGLTGAAADELSARFWRLVNRRINDAPELVAMLVAGYQPEMTGGGCLAWRKGFSDGSYIYVTYHEADIGGEPNEPVWIVGRYIGFGEETRVEPNEFLADVTLAEAMAFACKLEESF